MTNGHLMQSLKKKKKTFWQQVLLLLHVNATKQTHLHCNVSSTFDNVQLKYHQAQYWPSFRKHCLDYHGLQSLCLPSFLWHMLSAVAAAWHQVKNIPPPPHLLIQSCTPLFPSLSFAKAYLMYPAERLTCYEHGCSTVLARNKPFSIPGRAAQR